jgi:demethylmenaquinone methyltransferase/2-methoxy-6-polyprenyl-1,4-benzoquinol methylase
MPTSVEPDVMDDGLRRKEPAEIAGMFDAIAPRYDLLNFVLSAGHDRRWRRRAVDALDLRPSDVMLDVCTGTADMAVEAIRREPRLAAIIGVDFSLQMLRLAAPKLRKSGRVPALLAQADATALPLRDEEVDAATIAFGIRNVQRPQRARAELARVIRSGGRLAVLEFGLPRSILFRAIYGWYANRILPLIGRVVSRHRNAYAYLPESVARFQPPEAFAALLTSSGFSQVATVPLTLGIVYLYVARK